MVTCNPNAGGCEQERDWDITYAEANLARKTSRCYVKLAAKIRRRAGSQTITTSNYGVQPTYYQRVYPEDWECHIYRDTEIAARLAVEAREKATTAGTGVAAPDASTVRVLGSLPPFCESHRVDLFEAALAEHGEDFFVRIYRGVAEALVRGGVDAFIPETMNNWKEASFALRACRDFDLPIILCLEGALRDEHMRPHPELAPSMAKLVLEEKARGARIEALGFNCAPPEHILASLQAVKAEPGLLASLREADIQLAAYANCCDREAVHNQGFDGSDTNRVTIRRDLAGDDNQFEGYTKFAQQYISN
eukprot:gene22717-27423_t